METSGLGWLGGRRFWLVVVAVVVFTISALLLGRHALGRSDAVVPVVTLSGPSDAVAGETARYAVLVRDRKGAPLGGAKVRIGFWKRSLLELASGTTSDGGDATLEVRFPPDFKEQRTLVVVASAGVADSSDSVEVSPKTPPAGNVFLSTDKPIYQPGQTVHLRALALAGDKPVADRPVTLLVRTSDGIKVFQREVKSSAFGVVTADFDLADQVKLGAYNVHVAYDVGAGPAASSERSFEVARYSLPKLKLALEDVSALTPTGALRGRARATWIFGEPVTKAQVSVRLSSLATSSIERTANGATDRDGVFTFELSPRPGRKASEQPRGAFTLQASMTLESGLSATVSKQLSTLEGAEIPIETFPESGVFAAGVAEDVWVVAGGAPDKRGGLTVQALPDGPKVKTTREGIAKLPVPAPVRDKDGSLPPTKILVYAEDGSEGHAALTPLTDALVVRPDKDGYAPGAEAKIKVLGGGAGDRIALRLTRGDEPIGAASCVVESLAAGCEARATLLPSARGLVWVHAISMPRPGAQGERGVVKAGRRLVLVGARDRDLTIQATPSKPVFAPRETGTVGVAVTTAAGQPIRAELGASVVDEAVFQLAQVRPDLEKSFFTVDKDVALARQPAYFWPRGRSAPPSARAETSLPSGWEARQAYDPATPAELRGAILSVLTTVPPRGAIFDASSSAVELRASQSLGEARRRLGAWTILFFAGLCWAALGGFCLYGFARWRRATPPAASAEDVDEFRRETRGLVFDWLLGVFAPPFLAAFSMPITDVVTRSSGQFSTAITVWAALTLPATLALFRSVRRVRRTAIGREATTFRQVLLFLPPAVFFGHLAGLLTIGDEGEQLGTLFPGKTAILIPLLIAVAVQLASGLLSLVRHTMMGEVKPLRRVWLVLGRATFMGLPVSLLLFGLVVGDDFRRRRQLGWEGYLEDIRAASGLNSDNMEGGTGVRAKGEEGAMGAPAAAAAPLDLAKAASGGGGVEAKRNTPVRPREDFPETLLWVPSLLTDAAGRAEIKVPFADSITTWRFGLTAVGAGGQLGSATLPLVVKQDFFVDAAPPPVLTQGDQVTVPVTVFNYLDRRQDVALALEGDGLSLTAAGGTRLALGPKEARGIRVTVRADKAGERTMTIRANGEARADAIVRRIDVTPNGFRVVRTTNGLLARARATTTSMEIPAGAIDGGNDLYVKVYGGPLSQVSESLDGVFRMPHGCFEQTSSTTYPSVLALDFLRRTKASSPELEAKARRYIAEGYQRILSFEVSGGGFSLFGGSDSATTALTAYGAMELADMARVAPVDEQLLSRTREWLYRNRSGTGGFRRSAKAEKDDVAMTAFVAWALAAGDAKDVRLGAVLDVVEQASGKEAIDPYALVLRANALLAGDRAAAAAPLLDRLTTLAIRDENGVHWSSSDVGVLYSYGASMDVEVTALATHALAALGREPELRAGALAWLVARRNGNGTWSTTQATIASLRALLDEARPAPAEAQDIAVTLDGNAVETVHLEPKARDVHRLTSLRRFATTGKHVLGLQASGTADVSFQLVGVHYLDWQRSSAAARGGEALAIDVAYAPNAVPTGTTTKCHVHVAWRGAEPARMPLVEVTVPPAFEAETDGLDALIGRPTSPVKRYTVERGKVSLYLADLPAAAPLDLDLPLRALHPARVTTLPSSVYLYYEPEVRAETTPTVLRAM